MEVGRLLDYDTVGEHLAMEDYDRLIRWGLLKTNCVSEVLVGLPGPTLSFSQPVPGDLLSRITYRSRHSERQIKHVVDRELRRAVRVHGTCRLAPESADELGALVSQGFAHV
ncbi:hypothetical protein [Streptomyces sp. NPDC001833]|uniref:hypothetical protein n=1 Tax=Streptomyces sp. NPDC001833 TaxID=3154658 RepID=UPI00332A9BDE